jgi:uncharacterized protein HemY
MMTRQQYLFSAGMVAAFLLLYFGFDTKSTNQQLQAASDAMRGEATDLKTLTDRARQSLTSEQTAALAPLRAAVDGATDDQKRVAALKNLSGWWFRQKQTAVAAGVAEEVAHVENSDSAWSVAGALYFEALRQSQDAELRTFCAGRAVKAFESAASLRPEQVEHRVNLALVYAEHPPEDNPMKAVMMLRDLEQKYPEEGSVYSALGRLAIKTGQWQRAIDRLEKARALEPDNPNIPCLLVTAYEGAGKNDLANKMTELCHTQ